jgi:cysteinyl-tRNA synthetase
LPQDVQALIKARESARQAKHWEEADRLRGIIKEKGYLVEDIKTGFKISAV